MEKGWNLGVNIFPLLWGSSRRVYQKAQGEEQSGSKDAAERQVDEWKYIALIIRLINHFTI